jgi:hypothetical protein
MTERRCERAEPRNAPNLKDGPAAEFCQGLLRTARAGESNSQRTRARPLSPTSCRRCCARRFSEPCSSQDQHGRPSVGTLTNEANSPNAPKLAVERTRSYASVMNAEGMRSAPTARRSARTRTSCAYVPKRKTWEAPVMRKRGPIGEGGTHDADSNTALTSSVS